MKPICWALTVIILTLQGVATAAQPLGCLIEPHRVAEVGSPVIGVIEAIHVERGDQVARGQPLATLRADVERMSVAVALTRAAAVGELNAAAASAQLAHQKLVRARELADQQFISSQALEQARAEAVVADNRLAQAREQRSTYASEHQLAQAQLGLRTIRSPSAGVIADRYLSMGERVEEKPIFRVAVVDPLRVEVVLPAALYPSVRKGMSMTITPEFPGAQPRAARVALVDKLIDGPSNTFRARLELPNADLALPAGLRCKADISSLQAVALRQPGSPPGAALAAPGESLSLRRAPRLTAASPPKL